MPLRRALVSLLLGAAFLTACGDQERRAPLAERGAELARSPSASRSSYNTFACLTCHVERPQDAGGRVLPGAPLAGASRRPSYWGGETLHLREAVGRCWVTFMRGAPGDLDGPTGSALEAWLSSLPDNESDRAAVPQTWTASVSELPAGDAAAGAALYARACGYCHGARGTGAGRLGALVSIIPEDTVREHASQRTNRDLPLPRYLALVTTEKVRHGSFLGYAGAMPPFSTEALPDADLAAILAYLNFPTE